MDPAPPATSQLHLRVFKEPLGFLRVIQFVFAILAFSTTCGFYTKIDYTITYPENTLRPTWHDFVLIEYPFRLYAVRITCDTQTTSLTGDFTSQSQFFVATGVLSFLYCIGSLALYVFYDRLYRENGLVSIADLAASGMLSFFWLISSSVWAQGVSDLKYFSNPANYFGKLCQLPSSGIKASSGSGNFATLNVSLIFGFANFLLWTAGLWFIYKETLWFKNKQAMNQQAHPSSVPSQ